jgi:hypothetical protein
MSLRLPNKTFTENYEKSFNFGDIFRGLCRILWKDYVGNRTSTILPGECLLLVQLKQSEIMMPIIHNLSSLRNGA